MGVWIKSELQEVIVNSGKSFHVKNMSQVCAGL